jgi:hypothetical protein
MKPSSDPSFTSITKDRNSAVNNSTKSDVMRVTFAFSMALAPPQMAARVIITVIHWKNMTCIGFSRNVFQTSIVSTPWESPPRRAIWK